MSNNWRILETNRCICNKVYVIVDVVAVDESNPRQVERLFLPHEEVVARPAPATRYDVYVCWYHDANLGVHALEVHFVLLHVRELTELAATLELLHIGRELTKEANLRIVLKLYRES